MSISDFTDLYPTFAELAGAKLPLGVTLDFRSLARVLKGETSQSKPWVYSHPGNKLFAPAHS